MYKIVIWGHPHFSHTHSYVNYGFYKAFKHMGYEIMWLHNDSSISEINAIKQIQGDQLIVFTEGFADKRLPIISGGTYFVHCCPDPKKYINSGARVIDTRWCDIWHKDHVYDYTLDKTKVPKVGPSCYLEPRTSNKIRVKNDHVDYETDDYDKFYLTWATDLLPEEFNFDDVYVPRKNIIHFCGNLTPNGRCENYSVFKPFIEECEKNNIQFKANDPFDNPLTEEEVKRRTQESILGIDLRGPEHLRNGYVPCRIFKNVSYGHLGLTNSPEVYKELDGYCLYEPDPKKLFYKAMEEKSNFKRIKRSMEYVRENHTYINRVKSMLEVVNEYK